MLDYFGNAFHTKGLLIVEFQYIGKQICLKIFSASKTIDVVCKMNEMN